MTPYTTDKLVLRRPETGWSTARRLRGKGVLRTCLPAVADASVTRTEQPDLEGNIVRGED